ncbi:hypothetical protein ANCCAN_01621 [Ancylostoma caninum]|uniref:Uncharacterized protein n=1 Tax=Ancylostoma caninum TaxID=29170 RepID=A0A368H989_ANCCA|nr:hypothetical protein ANCCAN_01621 [Ancylostoma caninum]
MLQGRKNNGSHEREVGQKGKIISPGRDVAGAKGGSDGREYKINEGGDRKRKGKGNGKREGSRMDAESAEESSGRKKAIG